MNISLTRLIPQIQMYEEPVTYQGKTYDVPPGGKIVVQGGEVKVQVPNSEPVYNPGDGKTYDVPPGCQIVYTPGKGYYTSCS